MITRIIIGLCFCTLLRETLSFKKKPILGTLLQASSGRIINGENATLRQFPWHAAIPIDNGILAILCGGSIISEEWILTAASCIYNRVDTFPVVVGTVDLLEEGVLRDPEKFYLHEEYDPVTLANDIALIKLREKLNFNDVIAPIALASEPLESGKEVTVSGFGETFTDGPGYTFLLKYISVTTITNSECAEFYEYAILESMVCTAAGSDPVKGICFGDNGGPAVLAADTDPILVGVASFLDTTGCENGNPSGFTRIANYRDWIQGHTGV